MSEIDRRTKRSADPTEALQYLVETVADRSGARALVLVDDDGHIVAGMGMPDDIVGLARATREVAWRRASAFHVDLVTRGQDVLRSQRLVVDLTSGVSRMDQGRVEGLFQARNPDKK